MFDFDNEVWYWLCKENRNYFQFLEVFLQHSKCDVNAVFTKHNNETTMLLAAGFVIKQIFGIVCETSPCNLEMMKLLDKYKFDWKKLINKTTNYDKNHMIANEAVFLRALEFGDTECVKYIIDTCNKIEGCCIDIFQTDPHLNETAIHKAVLARDVSKVEYLLQNVYFTNKNSRYHNDNTESDVKSRDDKDITIQAQALEYLNQKTSKKKRAAIHHACLAEKEENFLIFKLLVEYQCTTNPTDAEGNLPIHLACNNNNASIVKYIIDHNLCSNDEINQPATDELGFTPLMCAIAYQNLECVKLLCEGYLNADILTIQSPDGYTAIEYAVYGNVIKMLAYLISVVFKRNHVHDWESLSKYIGSNHNDDADNNYNDNVINFNHIRSLFAADYESMNQELQTYRMIDDIIENGINKQDFDYIAQKINYDSKEYLMSQLETIPQNDHENKNDDDHKHSDHDCDPDLNEVLVVGNWRVGELIGQGAFGRVHRGVVTDTSTLESRSDVALKFIDKSDSAKRKQFILREIESLKRIPKHDNIVGLIDYDLTGKRAVLVFELIEHGELFDVLKHTKYFSDIKICKTYFEQIVSALQTCHQLNIIHRDLKPQNLLLDQQFQLKIADFGLSKMFKKERDKTDSKEDDKQLKVSEVLTYVGTRGFIAPEIINQSELKTAREKQACDIFSLAVILWKMVNGINSTPFKEANPLTDFNYKLIEKKNYNGFWDMHGGCNTIDNSPLKDLFNRMFDCNPRDRIGLDQLIEHTWYQDCQSYNDPKYKQYLFKFMNDIYSEINVVKKCETENGKAQNININVNVKAPKVCKNMC